MHCLQIVLATFPVVVLAVSAQAEVAKDGILKDIRAGHAEIRKQLQDCVIVGDMRAPAQFPDIMMEITFYSRGDRMRCDQSATDKWRAKVANYPETTAVVASPVLSFTVQRMSSSAPYVLLKKDKVEDIEEKRRGIGIVSVIGMAPYALFGADIESIISDPGIKILADERPDPNNQSLRRIRINGSVGPGPTEVTGEFTFDESRHMALVEYNYGTAKEHAIAKVSYADFSTGRIRVDKVEVFGQKGREAPVLGQVYTVKSVSFEPPDESLFTVEHFGITLDEGSYIVWYYWLIGGGVLLIVLGFVGRKLYQRHQAA